MAKNYRPLPFNGYSTHHQGYVKKGQIIYRNPIHIPPGDDQQEPYGWKHILINHRENNGTGNSYFIPEITDSTLEEMILETCASFTHDKIDRRCKKKIYRFLKYNNVIGIHGETREECEWLVVVAKKNGFIKTAYPIPDRFCRSSYGISMPLENIRPSYTPNSSPKADRRSPRKNATQPIVDQALQQAVKPEVKGVRREAQPKRAKLCKTTTSTETKEGQVQEDAEFQQKEIILVRRVRRKPRRNIYNK